MKSIVAFVFFALVVALVALAATFTPQKLPVTAADPALSLPPAHPPLSMSLSALPTGSMESQAAFAYRGGAFGDVRQFGMTVALIHHPNGDLLIDTGFGRQVDAQFHRLPLLMRGLSSYHKGTPVADQLQAGGYDWQKLAGILLTHAHWDHVGGIPDLPPVPVWLNQRELDFVNSGDERGELLHSLGTLPYKIYDFDGGPYLGFEHSADVYGDGSIVLVPAPGHTPGSVIIFVTLPSQTRYAFIGDLVWQSEGLDLPAQRPWLSRVLVDSDAVAERETLSRVAGLHARFPDLHFIPAHDLRAYAAIPKYPAVAR